MASRNIADLDPRFRPMAEAFVEGCKQAGLEVLIYCTYRSGAEQDQLYAQGRGKPGKVVTNAKAGQSAHNWGMAFDGCPTVHGKPLWDEPLDGPHWQKYGEIGRAVGLAWGGDWPRFREGPHMEHPNWKQLKAPT